MRWSGETYEQLCDRLGRWNVRFALFPTQMNKGQHEGTWVWLEQYFEKIDNGFSKRCLMEDLDELVKQEKQIKHIKPRPTKT